MPYRKETNNPDAPPTPRERKAMMDDAIKRQKLIDENHALYKARIERRVGRKLFAWVDFIGDESGQPSTKGE